MFLLRFRSRFGNSLLNGNLYLKLDFIMRLYFFFLNVWLNLRFSQTCFLNLRLTQACILDVIFG